MRREKVGLTLDELKDLHAWLQGEQIRLQLQVMGTAERSFNSRQLIKLEACVLALIQLHGCEPPLIELAATGDA
jgi:hypothetical protein